MKGHHGLSIRLRHDIQRAGTKDIYEVLNYLIRQGHKGLGQEDIKAIENYLENIKKIETIFKEALDEKTK